jgi:hypothetical protein
VELIEEQIVRRLPVADHVQTPIHGAATPDTLAASSVGNRARFAARSE